MAPRLPPARPMLYPRPRVNSSRVAIVKMQWDYNGTLLLGGNQLTSLPDSFGSIIVGGDLLLEYGALGNRCLIGVT